MVVRPSNERSKTGKKHKNAFLASFRPYVQQSDKHKDWATLMTFASIYLTDPRTNLWNFCEKTLRIDGFKKHSYNAMANPNLFSILVEILDRCKKVFLFKFQRIATIIGLGNITLSRLKRERLLSLAKHVIIIRISYKEIVKTKIVFQWGKILSYQCKKVNKYLIQHYLSPTYFLSQSPIS